MGGEVTLPMLRLPGRAGGVQVASLALKRGYPWFRTSMQGWTLHPVVRPTSPQKG